MTAIDLRCSSCQRKIGVCTTDLTRRSGTYCDTWCLNEPPIRPMQDRDDQFKALVTLGMSPATIAKQYDIHRPNVYKVIGRD